MKADLRQPMPARMRLRLDCKRTALLIAITAVFSVAVTPAMSLAAGTGQYLPPEWLPLRVSSDGNPIVVGCVRTNCSFFGGPYHNYWAIDFIDDANQPGAPVFAAGKGQVWSVMGSLQGCGPSGTPANYVTVYHNNGVFSSYLHMSTVSVAKDQWVDENTEIGKVGAVGFTFPCPYYHLHYEVTSSGAATSPDR